MGRRRRIHPIRTLPKADLCRSLPRNVRGLVNSASGQMQPQYDDHICCSLTIKLPTENNLVHNRHGLQSHSKISQRIKGMRPQLYPRHCHLYNHHRHSPDLALDMKINLSSAEDFLKKWKKTTTKSQLYPPPSPHCVPNSKESVYSSLWIIVRSWIAIALT